MRCITFEQIASKLQDELAEIISANKDVSDYELIVYKYVFLSELGLPVFEDVDFQIDGDSFMIHIIPDDLEFSLLRKLDDAFDRFSLSFMPNPYNVIKLKFTYCGD